MESMVKQFKSKTFNLIFSVICLCVSASSFAHHQIILTDDIDKYDIGDQIEYFADSSNQLSLEQVIQRSDEFIKSESVIPNFGYTDASYWVKINYKYESDLLLEKRRYAIEIFYPLIDKIEVYQQDRFGKYSVSNHGDSQPFFYRSPMYRNHIIKFDAEPDKEKTIYMKFSSQGSLRISLRILSDEHLLEHVSYVELFYGLGFGTLLIMIIYNLFLFVSLRESMYLNYVFYTISFLVLQLSLTGHAFEFLWPSNVWLANYSVSIWGAIFILMSLIFLRSLLQTSINLPRVDSFLKLVMYISIINMIACFVIPYGISIRILSVFGIFIAGLLITTGLIGLFSGIRAARYYVVGCGCLWLGIVAYLMMAKGVITNSFWTENGILIAAIFELLIFSFALADRINFEIKQREKVQKESLEYLNDYVSVFEHAEEGLFRISLDGKFTNINSSLVHILGYRTKDDILNRPINPLRYFFAHFADVKKFIKIMRQNDRVTSFEIEYFKQGRQEKGWASCSVRLVRDFSNFPLYYEGSVLDITAKKDKELAEKRMEEIKATAEAKGIFLANMSHEIRTPMNSVLSFIELAQRLPGKTLKMENYLSKIKVSSQSLLRIINDILDLSKIEAGKLKLEQINFDIGVVASNIREIFSEQAKNRGIDFDFEIADDVPRKLIGDPERLNQVLVNLVSNAIKFTETGGVTVSVTNGFIKGKNANIKFEVKDTGIGIKRELMPLLFTPFNQLDDSVCRKMGGTGLGLSICSNLVTLMRGKIFAESIEGKGSIFTFSASFRMRKNVVVNEQFTKPVSAAQKVQQENLSHKKSVLIVEDNELNQEVLKELLSEFDVEIHVTENGSEGVDAIKEQLFDLVLMDLQMPEMNGYEAARKIRALGFEMPIVAITANALKGVKDKCLQAGMNDFMTKPIDVAAFINKITFWLNSEAELSLGKSSSALQLDSADEVTMSEEGSMADERPRTDQRDNADEITKANEVSLSTPSWSSENSVNFDDIIFSPDFKITLDQKHAVAGMAGNRNLFLRLLGEFVNNEKNAAFEIRTSIARGDKNIVRMRAHTIKGLAGSFGCEALYKICHIIQKEIDNQREENLEKLVDRFELLLAQFVESAELILKSSEKTALEKYNQSLNVDGDADGTGESMQVLGRLLNENNLSARDVIESMLKDIDEPNKAEVLQEIHELISGYDFNHARELFKTL